MSELPSPTEEISPLTAPDWPSKYTTQALSWFRELRLKISSIIHCLTKTLNAAVQIYEKTNLQDHPRYEDLQAAIHELQDWFDDVVTTETELTKDYLRSVWPMAMFIDIDIGNMVSPKGASIAVLEEMRSLRKEAREIAFEARYVARLAQDVAILLEEYEEGYVVEEMFPGFE
ncbi:hypothetical protein SI65_09528 [Aspergillus cristatus]|uniref:Uncharacterized protein n=2 Tax=cellular organisms TaxID=131567 RepID=A0A1E3B255_ASPCR|nr:hypothetical protein SI65_09528 [Aspergillus cristatus]